MLVPMAVCCFWHRIMLVVVVSIVMPMRMFMYQHCMGMLMSMCLHQMKHHPQQHEHPSNNHPNAARTVAHRQSAKGADEWGKCKH